MIYYLIMPARPIASAYISFGMVTIPISLYSASQTSESVSFRMLHKDCGTPLKQQYICPKEGMTVDRDNTVKGYEFAKDQYVIFTTEEIKAVEEEATKTIAIVEFVPLSDVDPIYFEKAYYIAPEKGGERAYRLLSKALEETGLAGIAQYAARGKQYLVLLLPKEDGVIMQQLRYADEIRPFSEVPMPEAADIKENELKLAVQLIQQTVAEGFHPEKYKDEVKGRLREVIQQKVDGQEITLSPGEMPKGPVIDLMEALKASLGQAADSDSDAKTPARKPAKASKKAADKVTPIAAAGGRKKAGR